MIKSIKRIQKDYERGGSMKWFEIVFEKENERLGFPTPESFHLQADTEEDAIAKFVTTKAYSKCVEIISIKSYRPIWG